ncbi:glycosyltransferase family 4 protein [Vibrio atypicus]|uniref:glycosyltransferase family 4 protein n=1 Tax=Vibrio atypicus TaxID=558271 RepID=UPI001358CA36|nr:glycosyltransferase family 4 protein [Vibrio atypicus]
MHICHVNLASGYHGGENQTLQLIKQQLKEGYILTVVANPRSPFSEAANQLGCEVVLASHFTQKHSRSITKNCSLVHVHEGRAIYWALIQKLLFGTPYIVTRRIDNPLKNGWLSKIAYSQASALIGLSRDIVTKISSVYPQAKVFRIPSSPVSYPSTEEQVRNIRKQFENKFLVIHAANMLKHKGFDVTISAAKLLQVNHPNIHFTLLGDGIERENLEAQATELTNVTLVGKQSNMGDWFSAANIQVHPSYSEGLGSVILEGMGSGLPIIGTNTGGIPDIIQDGINGRLIDVGDASALAEAIIEISSDVQLQERLISGGRETLKDFDIAHTSKQYLHIYNEVTL